MNSWSKWLVLTRISWAYWSRVLWSKWRILTRDCAVYRPATSLVEMVFQTISWSKRAVLTKIGGPYRSQLLWSKWSIWTCKRRNFSKPLQRRAQAMCHPWKPPEAGSRQQLLSAIGCCTPHEPLSHAPFFKASALRNFLMQWLHTAISMLVMSDSESQF